MRSALTLLTGAAAAALVATALPASAAHESLTAAGLTAGGTKITTFSLADGAAAQAVRLTGLEADRALVGLDYRVFGGDRTLYGVGDLGGLYAVDPEDGSVTKVGALTVPLEGHRFGVDFNPVANALRIVSDSGQNLRQSFAALLDGNPLTPQAATVRDGDLNYGGTATSNGGPTAGGTSTDGTLALGVTGAGYTGNDADPATGTALYDIDTAKDALALQAANPGVLTQVGTGLGLAGDVSETAGFDIVTDKAADGSERNAAYALLTVDGERGVYVVSLAGGTARLLTTVTRGVSDIAIAPAS